MALDLESNAFVQGGEIPKAYTCEGKDHSPPLRIKGVPAGTKSLALLVLDPDAPDPRAPQRTFVHWVLYNLPPTTDEIPEGASAKELPAETRAGTNDFGKMAYGGPCPPIGRHRYFFRLFALSETLRDLKEPSMQELVRAMEGKVLEEAELMGTYEKRASERAQARG